MVTIETVKVENFRSIISAEFPLSAYTPLIGYNNSGKSNLISAIQWLLRKSVLIKRDFNNPGNPIEVSGNISGITEAVLALMPEQQQQQIQPYINNESLKIKRVQPAPGGGVANVKLHVWNPATNAWVPNPTGIDNALNALLPEPIQIGAMEDAEEDATKAKTTTTIGKLLAEFIGPVRAAHEEELTGLLHELERRVSVDGDIRFAELEAIESAISQKISDLFPGIGARLHFPVPSIEDLIKSGTLKLFEGNGDIQDFSSYGHGTQRSVQMALIRHLAEVKRGGAAQQGTTLLLIDEPELYLHPFAIEQVRAALKTLSQAGYQVIFSTHSAQLVPSSDAQYALLLKKEAALGSHSRRRLRDAIQNVVPESTHQMEQLFTLSNSSQFLFADRVILAEGKTEVRLLPLIYEQVRGKTLGQEKHALIAQSGVNDTKKSMDILSAMDIPCKAIVDLDYVLTGGAQHGFIDPTHPDIAALKQVMQRLEANGSVTLDANTGLPKNDICTAARAYVLIAEEADAIPIIERLHEHFLAQGVWVWKKGDIEKHLGLSEKTEREWARFQTQVETDGIAAICADYPSTQAMVNWTSV